MQVFTGLPISQGLAAGKIIFLGTQAPHRRSRRASQPHSSRP